VSEEGKGPGQTAGPERSQDEDVLGDDRPGQDGQEGEAGKPAPLEMILREAEVIARNLKESGTRR
jgi:hypothetical protein